MGRGGGLGRNRSNLVRDSGGVGGCGRMERHQVMSLQGRQDDREILEGTGYPDAGKQTKIMITTWQPAISEPHRVLSTLHRLSHRSLTAFLCVVATISSPISQIRKMSNPVIELHSSDVREPAWEPSRSWL